MAVYALGPVNSHFSAENVPWWTSIITLDHIIGLSLPLSLSYGYGLCFQLPTAEQKEEKQKIEGRAHTKRRHTRPEGENERKICEKNIIITSNPHYSRSLEFIYIMIIEPSSNTMTPLVKILIALFPGQLFTWFWRHLFRLKSESKISRQDY